MLIATDESGRDTDITIGDGSMENEMEHREIIELAAKAAGLSGHFVGDIFCERVGNELCKQDHLWNPIVDGTNAIQLATKLSFIVDTSDPLIIRVGEMNNNGTLKRWLSNIHYNHYSHGNFPNKVKATYLAITTAAAVIGKEMSGVTDKESPSEN